MYTATFSHNFGKKNALSDICSEDVIVNWPRGGICLFWVIICEENGIRFMSPLLMSLCQRVFTWFNNDLDNTYIPALSNPFATRHMWRTALFLNTSKIARLNEFTNSMSFCTFLFIITKYLSWEDTVYSMKFFIYQQHNMGICLNNVANGHIFFATRVANVQILLDITDLYVLLKIQNIWNSIC